WRIDEVNAAGTTTGTVWNFTTIVAAPSQASSPSPADSSADIAVDADLSWTAGSGSASHDVYFGTSSPGSYQGNQAATTFDTGAMSNDTTYYWRIDEVNAAGTTTGSVWSFTTIVAAPSPASSPSPGNGATDVAVNADLSWTAGSGAASHDVYFGTSSPGSFQGNQAATTFDTGTMSNDTTYYWRIDEVNAAGTTTGTVWNFTTIVAAPSQASSPSPGNGVTDIAVNADLSWSAGSGATSHDVYFGTSSPGSFQGNQAATTFDPGTMANDTTYYWRIDEVNAGGTTTGTVWNFTTIVAAPGQASSPSPANAASDVDINADLSWTAGSGAASHDVYFGTSSPGAFQGNQAAITFEPGTMAYDTTYYWRIDEINVGGTTTGTVWNFTTESAPLPPPGQASNPSPADSATDVGVGADLSWTAGSNATSHDVYFGTSSPGTFQGNQTAVTFDPGTMDNDTTYYWRIDEINASGTTTGVVWNFTTVTAGGQVIEEFGDATNTDHPGTIEDTFTDAGTGNDNKSTHITVNTYNWPADTVANTTIIKWDLSSIPTDATVIDATLYLYQVETGGDTSYDIPVHKIINVNPVISTCTWNTYDGTNPWTGGADGGQSDIAAAEDTQVVNATNNEYKTWSVTNMVADWVSTPSGNYGMLLNSDSVASIDSHRFFASTEVVDASTRPKLIVTYTSGVTPPGQASSPSPADSATDVSINADLSWTAGSGADSHDVYFGTTSPGAFQGNQTATTFDTGSMSNDTTYYWRIDEVNTAGTTTGTVWSFTTIVAAPGQASNPSPADSATDVGIDTDLSWTAGSGSTSSDVYIGTTSPGTFQGNQTATTFEPGTMGYDTTYYWRIDEINVGGTTTGVVWSFTTEAAPPPLPGQANNPSPADSATDVAVSSDLSWTAGSDATSHDVYFGTTSPGTFQGNQTAATFDPGTMTNDTTYYWRIDEINATGTTTGVVWSFTTIVSAGDEIIGWWELDDASGGTASDSSAYGNDGTLVGPPAWTDDAERGWCLDFADANNYVTIPNESDYDLTGNMTVMAWMKAGYEDWRNFSTIIAKGLDGSGGWALQKASRANAMSFYVHVSGMPWDGVKAGVGIFDNQWHHVAGVYDGSNAYIYIDGGLDSNSVACSGNMATNNWDVWIGESSQAKDGGTNAREWNGLIDDVRVYNYALNQSEVNDIYTGGPTMPGQASGPSPADSATDVAVDADLSWTAGSGSTSSDVYFGTSSPGAFQGNQTASTFDPGTMANDTTYYWRIDEINAAGTTTGVVWSFTTVAAPAGNVEIIGSWVSGTSHTAEAGTNRLLVFTGHVEDNNADMNLTSVTYGGQSMTKVVEQNVGSGYRSYVVSYVIDEAGINAASGSDFVVTWAEAPSRSPGFSSVFLQNVNQTAPTAATDGNGTESSATLATSALSTNDGDMVFVAGTCGNSGEYSVNNGFTEGIEISIASADAVAGYKAATGAAETPSITHSNVNRQVVIGFVVQAQ
ncbi:MAG: LamG-like jellyroll fold domain-containing protein, partial [Planctomycetota bacterium]